MINKLTINKILWLLTAGAAAFVSTFGMLQPSMYVKVVTNELLPGALAQDLMSLVASIVMILLILRLKEHQIKKQIVILGILGYFFYAYGIYVIERTYTMYYLFYMAIFALSFWSIAFALGNIKKDVLIHSHLPRRIYTISAFGALVQPILFYPLWIWMLLPLMQTGKRIDSLYSIFILDLCFIMPTFGILSYYTFKKEWLGIVFLPSVYILGFSLIFSLVMSEIVKPLYNMPLNHTAFWQSLGLSSLFLILGTTHLWKLKITYD